MDVGVFKASKVRLVIWIVVPPILIMVVGLSSFALRQYAEGQLEQTKALSNVLPDVISTRKKVHTLVDDLGLSKEKRIASADQFLAHLEEKATNRNIDLKKTQILRREKEKGSSTPVVSAMVEAVGGFADFQLFLNDVKSAHPLVSARLIELKQGREDAVGEGFQLKIVFDLLLVGDVLKTTGGIL